MAASMNAAFGLVFDQHQSFEYRSPGHGYEFFILGGLLSVHVFSRMQVFVSSDEPVNTVTSGICGIGITLITLLIFKRAIIYVVDTFERPS